MSDGLDLVLRAIKSRRSLLDLTEVGLLYHNIVKLINMAVQDGLVDYKDDDSPFLTELGLDFLEHKPEQVSGGSSRWIEPADEKRRQKSDACDIYVPSRAVIKGLRGL